MPSINSVSSNVVPNFPPPVTPDKASGNGTKDDLVKWLEELQRQIIAAGDYDPRQIANMLDEKLGPYLNNLTPEDRSIYFTAMTDMLMQADHGAPHDVDRLLRNLGILEAAIKNNSSIPNQGPNPSPSAQANNPLAVLLAGKSL